MRLGQSRRLRVTTGCLTCRARRVKCDEKRPVCQNCQKRNRPCRYGNNVSAGRSQGVESRQRRNGNGEDEALVDEVGGENSSQRGQSLNTSRILGPVYEDVHHSSLISNPERGTRSTPSISFQADESFAFQRLSPSPPATNLCSILQYANLPGPTHSHDGSSDIRSPLYSALSHRPTPDSVDDQHHSIITSFRVPDPIQLLPAEVLLLRNYVERVSKWIDSFSHDQPFYLQVPAMALHCPMLLHSCLAVSAKQMTRAPQSSSPMLEHSPIFYYRQALQGMSHFLIEPRYSGSDELLASSIILSTYEILDVAGESFGSHLKGVASLIRSHRINGDETGIRGATYWTWYRHEVWVAFQARRQMFLDEEYWRPKAVDTFEGISIRDIANRVLFLFGQCITYYITSTKRQSTEDWIEHRQRRAKELEDLLEDWKMKLPRSMTTSCMEQPSKNMEEYQLPSVWFAYPESAVSHQLYHTSKILLTLRRSSTSDTAHDPFHTRRELEKSRREVFMVANSKIHETWGLISTQCLYIAGLVTDGVLERQRTLELIELCQKTSGRQTICIADQLREFWKVG